MRGSPSKQRTEGWGVIILPHFITLQHLKQWSARRTCCTLATSEAPKGLCSGCSCHCFLRQALALGSRLALTSLGRPGRPKCEGVLCGGTRGSPVPGRGALLRSWFSFRLHARSACEGAEVAEPLCRVILQRLLIWQLGPSSHQVVKSEHKRHSLQSSRIAAAQCPAQGNPLRLS